MVSMRLLSAFAVLVLSFDYANAFFILKVGNNIGLPTSTFPSSTYPDQTVGYYETPPYALQDIYAFAPDGYVFVNWSGDLTGISDPSSYKITVTMDRNRTIFANFVPAKHITITTRGYIFTSAPLLFDINQDGFREIIIGDQAGYVYCFTHEGEKLWEYYAGNAFDKRVSPIPEWFNNEVKNNNELGDITIQSSPAAGDIDGDTIPEIIVGVGGFGVGQGGILILNNNGTLKLLIRGYDSMGPLGATQDGFSEGFYSTPAISDIDQDGKLDFVIGGIDQTIYASKTTFKDTSKDANGNTIKFFRPPGKDGFFAVPIFELDDDGDGKFNEDPVGDYTMTTPYNTSDDSPGFLERDDDGDGLIDEGIPGDDDEDSCCKPGVDGRFADEDEFEWPFRSTDTVVSSPALADIDRDGKLDIIIGVDSSGGRQLKDDRKFIPSGGALRVLNMFAEEIGTFPQWIEQVVWSSPSVADINNGKVIFVGTGTVVQDGEGVRTGKALYAFKADGSAFLPGKSPYGLFAQTSDIIWSSPAIGDINGDGILDIVAADFSGYLYAWDVSGQLLNGFPMLPLQEFSALTLTNPHAQIRSSPVLADIDNDGNPEIIIGAGWSILAVNGDGTLVPEFRYGHASFTTATTSVFASPAAADLDNNGKVDLVWGTGVSSDGGATIDHGIIHVWELGNFNPQANPWPMFKRTGTRTSAYAMQFENPIFEPRIAQIDRGDTLKVSVNIYPGISPIANVYFNIEINGSLNQIAMSDNDTNGDAFANDGRYTATLQIPDQINSLGNMSFTARANNGERAEIKVSGVFSHTKLFDFVTKYYNDILDRPPDPAGRDWWTAEIERVVSLGIDVKEGFLADAKLFFNSQEYGLKNKNDTDFVTDLYQTFLNRYPDSGGLNFWVNSLSQGLTRDMLTTQFAYCLEFQQYLEDVFGGGTRRPENNLVNDLYRGFLNRFPDTGGFDTWLDLMRNAQCAGERPVRDLTYQIALAFVASPEYTTRSRNNLGYAEDLYNAILKRGADPGGFLNWVNVLSQGTSREDALRAFVDSVEFQFRVQEVIDAGCFQ